MGGAEKTSWGAATCLLLSALLLTLSVKGEESLGYDTSLPRASVSSAVWIECGPCPTGLILLILLDPQR